MDAPWDAMANWMIRSIKYIRRISKLTMWLVRWCIPLLIAYSKPRFQWTCCWIRVS